MGRLDGLPIDTQKRMAPRLSTTSSAWCAVSGMTRAHLRRVLTADSDFNKTLVRHGDRLIDNTTKLVFAEVTLRIYGSHDVWDRRYDWRHWGQVGSIAFNEPLAQLVRRWKNLLFWRLQVQILCGSFQGDYGCSHRAVLHPRRDRPGGPMPYTSPNSLSSKRSMTDQTADMQHSSAQRQPHVDLGSRRYGYRYIVVASLLMRSARPDAN